GLLADPRVVGQCSTDGGDRQLQASGDVLGRDHRSPPRALRFAGSSYAAEYSFGCTAVLVNCGACELRCSGSTRGAQSPARRTSPSGGARKGLLVGAADVRHGVIVLTIAQ